MSYSKKIFGISFTTSVIAVVGLMYLIWSSQMALALLPALGTGGFYAEAQFFEGKEGGKAYPEMIYHNPHTGKNERMGGDVVNESRTILDGATDTFECKSVPMMVVQLDDARVYGFNAKVNIPLPVIDRWMSIGIKQPIERGNYNKSAYIKGEQINIYVSQLNASYLKLKNVRITEMANAGDGKYRAWGPESDQFMILADPGGDVEGKSIFAKNVSAWMHAVTGDQITFHSNAKDKTLEFDVSYPSEGEVQLWKRNHKVANYVHSNAPPGTRKSNYNRCLPGGKKDVR